MNNAERQQVFNKVINFLLDQGEPGYNKAAKHCQYGPNPKQPNPNNTYCAVGCLLPTDHPAIHNNFCGDVESLTQTYSDTLDILNVDLNDPNDLKFYRELQWCHDSAAEDYEYRSQFDNDWDEMLWDNLIDSDVLAIYVHNFTRNNNK